MVGASVELTSAVCHAPPAYAQCSQHPTVQCIKTTDGSSCVMAWRVRSHMWLDLVRSHMCKQQENCRAEAYRVRQIAMKGSNENMKLPRCEKTEFSTMHAYNAYSQKWEQRGNQRIFVFGVKQLRCFVVNHGGT